MKKRSKLFVTNFWQSYFGFLWKIFFDLIQNRLIFYSFCTVAYELFNSEKSLSINFQIFDYKFQSKNFPIFPDLNFSVDFKKVQKIKFIYKVEWFFFVSSCNFRNQNLIVEKLYLILELFLRMILCIFSSLIKTEFFNNTPEFSTFENFKKL